MYCMNRRSKTGGEVAIFVDKSYSFKAMDNMSAAVDNVLECITIEISRVNKKIAVYTEHLDQIWMYLKTG